MVEQAAELIEAGLEYGFEVKSIKLLRNVNDAPCLIQMLVRPPGFEPGSLAWKAKILTRLDHGRQIRRCYTSSNLNPLCFRSPCPKLGANQPTSTFLDLNSASPQIALIEEGKGSPFLRSPSLAIKPSMLGTIRGVIIRGGGLRPGASGHMRDRNGEKDEPPIEGLERPSML